MKAIVYEKYGSPEVLRLADVETPVAKPGEVLVRVRATSINSWDRDLLTGTFQGRMGHMAWRTPKLAILGADVAGHVEAVGRGVDGLRPGDAVFGDIARHGFGGFAEYVSVPATALAIKPESMTFEQAAATPQAGLLALQALRDTGQLRPGHRVLINGAGGGVGTFAVQIAKAAGVEVTGVDHHAKLDTVRTLGADRVIDCTHYDFTRDGQRYDLIVDVVAARSLAAYRRALLPKGIAVIVGGSMRTILASAALGWVSWSAGRRIRPLIHRPTPNDLTYLDRFFQAGSVIPQIDSVYPLAETRDAFHRYEAGNVMGKLVITT